MNESSLKCDTDNALSCQNCGSADVERHDNGIVCRRCLLTLELPKEIQVLRPWADNKNLLRFESGAALLRHIEECEQRLQEL